MERKKAWIYPTNYDNVNLLALDDAITAGRRPYPWQADDQTRYSSLIKHKSHQLLVGIDLWTSEFNNLASHLRIIDRLDNGVGHVKDVDWLKFGSASSKYRDEW